MNLEQYLLTDAKRIIESWNEKDIYAISFLVYTNENKVFKNIKNFPAFSIGYNTKSDCENADVYSEERWNFAFWQQNNIPIVDSDENTEGAQMLYNWYLEKGMKNIGFEDLNNSYDKKMNYIGKGPTGYYEFLMLISNIARKLQTEGIILNKFGNIPIIVHDYEYCWYIKDATENANPNNQAKNFLVALENNFQS